MDKKLYLKRLVVFQDIVDEQFVRDICINIRDHHPEHGGNIEFKHDGNDLIIRYNDSYGGKIRMDVFADGTIMMDINSKTCPLPYQMELMNYYLKKGYYTVRSESDNFIQ